MFERYDLAVRRWCTVANLLAATLVLFLCWVLLDWVDVRRALAETSGHGPRAAGEGVALLYGLVSLLLATALGWLVAAVQVSSSSARPVRVVRWLSRHWYLVLPVALIGWAELIAGPSLPSRTGYAAAWPPPVVWGVVRDSMWLVTVGLFVIAFAGLFRRQIESQLGRPHGEPAPEPR